MLYQFTLYEYLILRILIFLDNIIAMENYDVQLSTSNSKNSKMDYNKQVILKIGVQHG